MTAVTQRRAHDPAGTTATLRRSTGTRRAEDGGSSGTGSPHSSSAGKAGEDGGSSGTEDDYDPSIHSYEVWGAVQWRVQSSIHSYEVRGGCGGVRLVQVQSNTHRYEVGRMRPALCPW